MLAKSVHQFHIKLSAGDAISNQVLGIRRLLHNLGYRSEVFCEQVPVGLHVQAKHFTQYKRYTSADSILLLHFSTAYSPVVMEWLAQLPDRKVLIYHNITPHTYFAGINDVYMAASKAGREQLPDLQSLTCAGWADSAYNAQELISVGWEQTGVLPIIFDARRYQKTRPDRAVLQRFPGTNLLFVGRVAPNKCFEDLILTFTYLKRRVCPAARLLLVGSSARMQVYLDYLHTLVKRLALEDVVFTGHVSDRVLMAYYRSASVYLSMSEHEGFGVPLLESMHFGVPVVAYKAAAVPETLGDSGMLITQKVYPYIAELLGILIADQELRQKIIAGQRERLKEFAPERIQERLRTLLHELA